MIHWAGRGRISCKGAGSVFTFYVETGRLLFLELCCHRITAAMPRPPNQGGIPGIPTLSKGRNCHFSSRSASEHSDSTRACRSEAAVVMAHQTGIERKPVLGHACPSVPLPWGEGSSGAGQYLWAGHW